MEIINSAAVQVPCFVILCMLVWKLGALAIGTWAKGDADRTKAMTKSDDERTLVIAKGFADITAELKVHGERIGRIENRLDVREVIIEAIDDAATGGIPIVIDDAHAA